MSQDFTISTTFKDKHSVSIVTFAFFLVAEALDTASFSFCFWEFEMFLSYLYSSLKDRI